jgi:hypothetical protein
VVTLAFSLEGRLVGLKWILWGMLVRIDYSLALKFDLLPFILIKVQWQIQGENGCCLLDSRSVRVLLKWLNTQIDRRFGLDICHKR